MDNAPDPTTDPSGTPAPLSLSPAPRAAAGDLTRWERRLLWSILSCTAVLVIAWTSVHVQAAGFAPAGLMPLLLGRPSGSLFAKPLTAIGFAPARRVLLIVAAVGGLAIVPIEDYIDYRTYQAKYESFFQGKPQLEMIRADDKQGGPASFARFMEARVHESPIAWTLDLVLTIVGALGWTFIRRRADHARGPATAEHGPFAAATTTADKP